MTERHLLSPLGALGRSFCAVWEQNHTDQGCTRGLTRRWAEGPANSLLLYVLLFNCLRFASPAEAVVRRLDAWRERKAEELTREGYGRGFSCEDKTLRTADRVEGFGEG